MLQAASVALEAMPPLARETIVVAPADLQQLRDGWMRSTGRPPTPAELDASLARWLGDEALFREALRRGLDRDDPVVAQRLLLNLRFAFPDRHEEPGELLELARALGMVHKDLVIRRRLVQRMEGALLGELRISEAELREYVAAHPQRYAQPARYAFDHVFVARDDRRADPRADALALAARLRAGEAAAGDAFALPGGDSAQSREEIAQRLGDALADAIAGAEPGQWIGPVDSAWGWHLVRVSRTVPAAPADFDQVREAAARAFAAERRESQLRKARERLSARYRLDLPAGVVPGAAG